MDGMEMDHSHGSMGSMSMGGVPNLFYLQKMFWAVIGTAIGLAALSYVGNLAILWYRSCHFRRDAPAKPGNFFLTSYATATAIIREIANTTIPPILPRVLPQTSFTLGKASVVLADLVLVLVLCFYKLDPEDQWQFEDIGYRTGFVAAAQLPLVILLAGKRNIVGFFVGCSYERLNWLHRWVSRVLFLTVTIHMGFWFRSWARYDYITIKLKTDAIVQRGFAAWVILLWIFLTSFAPVRRWNYELFVAQHIVTFVGFLAAVFLHLPAEVKIWIWLPIGLYAFDRFLRTLLVLYHNLSLCHPKRKSNGILTCEGTLESLGGGSSRIIIMNPPFKWRPGQHVFLSCHNIAPLQAHPFTIASILDDERLEFIVKSKAGATKRFFSAAEKDHGLPTSRMDSDYQRTFPMIVDGPYGNIRPLHQFDSLFLIAGASGGSFTVPLMRDVVARWRQQFDSRRNSLLGEREGGAVTRYVRFVWVVKSPSQYTWASHGLAQASDDVQNLRTEGHMIALDVSIYITCDTSLAAERTQRTQAISEVMTRNQHAMTGVAENGSVLEMKPVMEGNSVSSTTSGSTNGRMVVEKACQPDGTCCCKATIEDEDEIRSARVQQACCCCNVERRSNSSSDNAVDGESVKPDISPPAKSSTEVSNDSKSAALAIHPALLVLTGRPHPKTLIRKTLEQARGESAVVVCGPQGLNDDVRNAVVTLSDERAVHKGTRAQGIYLWEEGFQY